MSYSLSSSYPLAGENSFEYASSPIKKMVYEVSLKPSVYSAWLSELHGAHRLLQALLQGQLLGQYQLLDFIISPSGLFVRVTLGNGSTLSDFLNWIKERSCPSGESSLDFWNNELQWIKLVPPDRLPESTRIFHQKAEALQREIHQSPGGQPHLFFYYRDQRLT